MGAILLKVLDVKTELTLKEDDGQGGERDVTRDLTQTGQFQLDYQLIDSATRTVLFEGSRTFGSNLTVQQRSPERARATIIREIEAQAQSLVLAKGSKALFSAGEEIELK